MLIPTWLPGCCRSLLDLADATAAMAARIDAELSSQPVVQNRQYDLLCLLRHAVNINTRCCALEGCA